MEPVLKQNIGEGQRRGWGGGERPEAEGQRGRGGECPGGPDLPVQIRELLATPGRVYAGAYSLWDEGLYPFLWATLASCHKLGGLK